ncbi:hypothetical protein Godav_009916 [Gossypium davidsonii]|uniref:Protein kinase domain-containing protein n=1 Tax=Gossypium davidsonii TaxID=34287 RepID=A0A7J8SF92_GOSDV|nr:hypothetical protein [Gossypium davidsonii]
MESNVKRFARSMLKGLNFFHSQWFVHCDIKLQNVLLFCNGDVKIVDIWALGCAVVEIFSGKLAWHLKLGPNMVDLLIKIGANDELPRIPRELSGEGKDFMEKFFSRDPNKRWIAEMLLQHPFMASDDEIVPSTSSRGFGKIQACFHWLGWICELACDEAPKWGVSRSWMRKKKQNSTSNTPTSTASPSTRSSSQTQLQELEQIFNKLDVNGDGKISLSELGSIMGSLAQKHQSKEELQKMMKEFKADYGDGFMNFDQFVELNTKGVESEEVLKDAFSVYDRNGNGWISAEELQEVLKSLGDECSIEECRKMVSGVDNDGNGMIDFQEFKVMMVAAHSIQPLNGLNL